MNVEQLLVNGKVSVSDMANGNGSNEAKEWGVVRSVLEMRHFLLGQSHLLNSYFGSNHFSNKGKRRKAQTDFLFICYTK